MIYRILSPCASSSLVSACRVVATTSKPTTNIGAKVRESVPLLNPSPYLYADQPLIYPMHLIMARVFADGNGSLECDEIWCFSSRADLSTQVSRSFRRSCKTAETHHGRKNTTEQIAPSTKRTTVDVFWF